MNPAPMVDLEVVEHAPRLRCDFRFYTKCLCSACSVANPPDCTAPAVFAYRGSGGVHFRCDAHRLSKGWLFAIGEETEPPFVEQVIP